MSNALNFIINARLSQNNKDGGGNTEQRQSKNSGSGEDREETFEKEKGHKAIVCVASDANGRNTFVRGKG